MNRAQRRKLQKNPKNKHFSGKAMCAATNQPDFSNVPLVTVCQSIQLLIDELYSRGFPVYDFDSKNKFVQGIQIIQGKVYFLAAEEDSENEKI